MNLQSSALLVEYPARLSTCTIHVPGSAVAATPRYGMGRQQLDQMLCLKYKRQASAFSGIVFVVKKILCRKGDLPWIMANRVNFSGQTIYVGIDVHRKNWSVSILMEMLNVLHYLVGGTYPTFHLYSLYSLDDLLSPINAASVTQLFCNVQMIANDYA